MCSRQPIQAHETAKWCSPASVSNCIAIINQVRDWLKSMIQIGVKSSRDHVPLLALLVQPKNLSVK